MPIAKTEMAPSNVSANMVSVEMGSPAIVMFHRIIKLEIICTVYSTEASMAIFLLINNMLTENIIFVISNRFYI